MNTSSRFVVATHVLTVLATFKLASGRYEAFKSNLISESVNTNPVVIRRILSMLKRAGLVVSHSGPSGGSRLARNPEDITLFDIYQAVEDSGMFHLHYSMPNQECPIGYNIQDTLSSVLSDAQTAVKDVLTKKSLSGVAQEIMDRSGITEKLSQGLSPEQLREKFVFRSGKLIERSYFKL